ncbi:DUF6507 family protein [Pseudonocardia lacus]|uniref:DUF6507 family protein n=1 Tax=Pseudonocardia lacus TaxID=2835865 RepID=UPI001BDC4BE6|nr:DUF6507 family protein [Pseudonocardia lacus]
MTRWDIDPAGVRSVLTNTEAVAQEFDGQMQTLNTGIEGAAAQSSSEIVASALAGFAESAAADIGFVFTRTGACLSGAAQATNAYVEGDLQMAANAQASADAAPDPRSTMPGYGR